MDKLNPNFLIVVVLVLVLIVVVQSNYVVQVGLDLTISLPHPPKSFFPPDVLTT